MELLGLIVYWSKGCEESLGEKMDLEKE